MLKRWIVTIWLAFITVRYGAAANSAVHSPFNPGGELRWVYVSAGLVLALAITAALLRNRVAINRVWFVVGITLAMTFLIMSRTALPAMIALVVLGVSAGLGEFVFQRLRLPATALVDRLVMTVPVGIGFIALGQLLLGLARQFNSFASWAMMLALAVPAIFGLRNLFALRFDRIGKPSWTIVPIGYAFLMNLTWAASPEVQFDALNVHLAVPRLYLEQGALVNLPYFFHSYFAHLLDMVFGSCLALGGPLVVKFFVLGCGALAGMGVYAVGRTLFSEEVGRWASLFFYTTPLVIWASGTAYLDVAFTLFITASVLAFIRWYEEPDWGWLAVSGWIAGVAIGTKAVAVTTLGILPIIAAWHSRRVRSLAVYLIPMLLAAIPWFLVVYAQTCNPVFPYMNAIFRSPQWRFENPTFNANEFGIGTSPGALLRLPFRFALNSEKFGEGLPRGGAGIGLLLAFPFALIFLFRGRPAQRIVLAVTAVHIVAWTLTFQYARYMTPVLPFLAIIGCAVFLDDSTGRRRLNRVLLGCCVFAQLAIAPVLFWNIPERFPLSRALGLESEEDFLSRALLGYRSARALNSMLQPQDKILGANVESLRFYLKGPLYTMAESRIILDKIETARDLAVWQTEHGFKYVLAPQTDVQHPAPYFLFLRPPFLKEFGTLRYSDEEAAVFEVSPPDPTPRSPSPDEPAVDRVVVDPPVVRLNQSYTARFVGRNLTEGVYFDVRVRSPGSAKETTVLNWQQGTSAPHNVPAGMEPGDWIITAVRAHLDPDDRRAAFAPVSAKIRVVSK